MVGVILVKVAILSVLWTFAWLARFTAIAAPITLKNISIVFAPFIVFIVYILVFWWG